MLPDQENTLLHRLALTFIKDIGPRRASGLLNHFGNVENIFKASAKELKHADGLGENLARGFKEQVPEAFQKAEEEMAFIQKHHVQALWIEDEQYPQRMKNCLDAPMLFYYKGNGNLNGAKMVAVVGTRKYTDYGQRLCDELIEGLKGEEDIVIVSGLAHGIDTIAHKDALKNGLPTIGALGHGLDRIYPATNKTLQKKCKNRAGYFLNFLQVHCPTGRTFRCVTAL